MYCAQSRFEVAQFCSMKVRRLLGMAIITAGLVGSGSVVAQ
jgi:hypothetical protein